MNEIIPMIIKPFQFKFYSCRSLAGPAVFEEQYLQGWKVWQCLRKDGLNHYIFIKE